MCPTVISRPPSARETPSQTHRAHSPQVGLETYYLVTTDVGLRDCLARLTSQFQILIIALFSELTLYKF
jgi:hypothetical protein